MDEISILKKPNLAIAITRALSEKRYGGKGNELRVVRYAIRLDIICGATLWSNPPYLSLCFWPIPAYAKATTTCNEGATLPTIAPSHHPHPGHRMGEAKKDDSRLESMYVPPCLLILAVWRLHPNRSRSLPSFRDGVLDRPRNLHSTRPGTDTHLAHLNRR